MTERKGSLITKSVAKHAGRAKEKFLQNLGKVDRTADDIFDEHLDNFNRQQQAASRLQKEFNNYIRCIRAVQGASKSLYECINDVYEAGWPGQDVLYAQSQNIEMLWQDLNHKLADQVLLPLNTYYAQFPETKKKIDKRNRKLVDYDGQRHNMQSLEGGGGKKRDDAKILKSKEQLQFAKRMYDTLNSELHDELPALYHSRILFFVNNLQTLFSTEQVFHAETAKVYSELEAIIDKLANETQKQSYSPRKLTNSLKSNNINAYSNSPGSPSSNEDVSEPLESPRDTIPSPPPPQESEPESSTEIKENEMNGKDNTNNSNTTEVTTNGDHSETIVKNSTTPETNNNRGLNDNGFEIPAGATTENLPPGVLFRVKATYKYNREDVDELSFEVGEIIRVVQYDDPEEQEEGWLMGIKETTNEKGMFPANFTRPL